MQVIDSYGRAYIGSSGGEIFIFNTTTSPKPTFIYQFTSYDGAGIAALVRRRMDDRYYQ